MYIILRSNQSYLKSKSTQANQIFSGTFVLINVIPFDYDNKYLEISYTSDFSNILWCRLPPCFRNSWGGGGGGGYIKMNFGKLVYFYDTQISYPKQMHVAQNSLNFIIHAILYLWLG